MGAPLNTRVHPIQFDRELVTGGDVVIWDDVITTGDFSTGTGRRSMCRSTTGPGDTPVCTAETITLASPGRVSTTKITLTQIDSGQYGAQETLRGKDGQIVSQGAFGAASETSTVAGAMVSAADSGQLAITGPVVGRIAGAGALMTATGVAVRFLLRRRAEDALMG